jgi:hypothetical protein
MASKYWLKLYYEMLDDPKVARLSDSSYRRFIECLLLAGETDAGGLLPPLEDMSWRLRVSELALDQDMSRLAMAGLVTLVEHDGDNRWFVVKFSERQAAISGAERVNRFRQEKRKAEYHGNERVTEGVTIRYTDTDTDTDTDKIQIGASLDAWGEFSGWHAGERPFSELSKATQGKIRQLGGDSLKRNPAYYYKKDFSNVR